jgi:tetratricopeptide (TPR) repeat protein
VQFRWRYFAVVKIVRNSSNYCIHIVFSPSRKYDISMYSRSDQMLEVASNVDCVDPSSVKSLMSMAHQKSHPKKKPNLKFHTENQAAFQKQMKDYTMLAFSSRRAGRHQMEGAAYYSMGVLLDNMEAYEKAIDQYKKFIGVCKNKTKDVALEALGYNCVGVGLHLMAAVPELGEGLGQSSSNGTTKVDSLNTAFLESSVKAHKKHLEIADDAGRFVAHTNLGLALSDLGKHVEAAKHHQDALRLAIRLQSTHGQSVAVGNLGMLGTKQGDLVTAKACMEQHLQLVQSLHDLSAESNAWMQLGLILNKEGAFEQAALYFDRSRRISMKTGEMGTMKRSNCYIGVAQGNQGLHQRLAEISTFARANSE